jgi:hypothetical protein
VTDTLLTVCMGDGTRLVPQATNDLPPLPSKPLSPRHLGEEEDDEVDGGSRAREGRETILLSCAGISVRRR